jgi:hypothetical protein
MNIYTYYEDLQFHGQPKVIDIWTTSWEKLGFNPIVLNEKDAQKSTLYDKYSRHIKTFPSVNASGFDYHCFMRYLAISAIAYDETILSTEPDVINYGLEPKSVLDMKQKDIIQYSVVPALHIGNNYGFTNFCEQIINHKVNDKDNYLGQPHLSDQDFIANYSAIERIYPNPYVAEVFEEGYLEKPVVHFGTPYMSLKGYMPKYIYINKIRPLL